MSDRQRAGEKCRKKKDTEREKVKRYRGRENIHGETLGWVDRGQGLKLKRKRY